MKRRNFILDTAASVAGAILPRGLPQKLCIGGMTGVPASLATGEMDAEADARRAFLKLAQETLSPLAYEEGHYRDYFEWRFRNLPQSRNLYIQFSNQFAAQHSLRGRIQALMARSRGPSGVTLDVQAEILELFARTDLRVLQGYRAWPGTPRGYTPEERPGSDG
jgi:hypothetical protein